MASSDHMASVDPWIFARPSFIDPWFVDAYSRDTETLTKALQKSLSSAAAAAVAATAPTATTTTSNNSNNSSDTLTPDVVSPFLKHHPEPAPSTPAAGAAAPVGSDQEATASKRQRVSIPGASGKVSKRKSRASKRSQTTYITADPANFRQMVQQVTGARFVGTGLHVSAPILKPEPQRPSGGRLIAAAAAAASGCLPTLDTSAFLLDHPAVSHHHQQQQQPEQEGMAALGGAAQGQLSFLEASDVVGSGGLDFGSFAGFPTLESWSADAM